MTDFLSEWFQPTSFSPWHIPGCSHYHCHLSHCHHNCNQSFIIITTQVHQNHRYSLSPSQFLSTPSSSIQWLMFIIIIIIIKNNQCLPWLHSFILTDSPEIRKNMWKAHTWCWSEHQDIENCFLILILMHYTLVVFPPHCLCRSFHTSVLLSMIKSLSPFIFSSLLSSLHCFSTRKLEFQSQDHHIKRIPSELGPRLSLLSSRSSVKKKNSWNWKIVWTRIKKLI